MSETKKVHFHVYNPRTSVFGRSKSAKAKSYTVTCGASDRCELLSRGECAARSGFGGCLYGRQSTQTGWTPKAQKFSQWIRDQKDANEGVGSLSAPRKMLAVVGDHVWLPYAHVGAAFNGGDAYKAGWRDAFVPLEDFTPETIARICNAKPRALFGGVITTYQRDEVPRFVAHVAERFPGLLDEACKVSPNVAAIRASLTNVGRKARLVTTLPWPKLGRHGWAWDGEWLTLSGEAAKSATILMDFKAIDARMRPGPEETVVIVDDAQVGPDTVFVD